MSIYRSLKRLNTDYLDIVLVHSDGNDVYNIRHHGILDCLKDFKQQGLIRAYGMSTKTVEGGLLALEQSDVAMVMYNPVEIKELPVIQEAYKSKKGIFIKKALASGHLDHIKHPNPADYALQFIIQEPGVSSIILGTINQEHLTKNCKAIESNVHLI